MDSNRRSRRTFLTTSALAAAAAAAPRSALATPSGPRGKAYRLKLGLASYSARKLTLDQTLELCRDADIAYVNIKDFHMPRTDSLEATAATRKKIEDQLYNETMEARFRRWVDEDLLKRHHVTKQLEQLDELLAEDRS